MNKPASQDIGRLVEPDRVHASVYTDPGVFALEMTQLFGRAWNYVGHESQIPKPGDYFCTRVANRHVIMMFDTDGDIHVLGNRCSHRGARLLDQRHGHCAALVCPYHGWTYHRDGRLKSIPRADGYQNSRLTIDETNLGLPRLRSESYRGFVFATLDETAESLEAWLGEAARTLDNIVDRSPDGELRVRGGCLRVIQRNNWKIYLENLHDGMHPMVVHQSSIAASRAALAGENGSTGGRQAVEIVNANAQSYEQLGELQVACYDHGHSDMRGFREPTGDDPVFDAYRAALTGRHGGARAGEILATNIHNACFYPNFSVHPGFMQLRVIFPLSVDRTLVEHWCLSLGGAPEELNRRNITYANTVHSPSSLIKSDDLDVYRRVQKGLSDETTLWVSNHRRADRDDEGAGQSSALSEQFIRNQYRAWLDYMRDDRQR